MASAGKKMKEARWERVTGIVGDGKWLDLKSERDPALWRATEKRLRGTEQKRIALVGSQRTGDIALATELTKDLWQETNQVESCKPKYGAWVSIYKSSKCKSSGFFFPKRSSKIPKCIIKKVCLETVSSGGGKTRKKDSGLDQWL